MKNYRAARLVVVGAMLMFLSIVGASAATFYYDAYGGFVSGTDSPGGSGTFVNDPDTATGGTFDVGANADPRMAAGRFVDVTWGNPSGVLGPYGGKSGFAISKVDNGTVITDGTAVDFGKLTHFNRPIGAGSDLDSVQLDWRLQLFATAIDATNDVNQFQTVDLNFTIYNWETPNSPASNPAYSISTDGGASFHLGPSGVCPGSYTVGTLIVGPLGKIYRSQQLDDITINPAWNGECGDAHVYEGNIGNNYDFVYAGRNYVLQLSGFYNALGALTGTFWACENQACLGTVKLLIADVTPDLTITKSDGSPTYTAGAPISYSIVVSNVGPGNATGASVADTVPVAITGVTANCVATGTASCGTNGTVGNAVSFTNVDIAAGAGNFLTITVAGTVNPNATGNLVNTATVAVGTGQTDPTPGNNTATDTDTPAPSTDLVITKTDGSPTYTAGAPISYSIVVSNAGPSNATGASVADTVPANITGVTANCVATGTASCGTNGTAGNAVSYTNVDIAAGAGNFLTITVAGTVSPAATGNLVNTATVTAGTGQTDPTPGNNTATDTDTPAPSTDLAITKTDGSPTYTAGTAISYSIVVSNAGPSNATGASVADTVPATITGVTANCVATGTASCGTNGTAGNAVSFTNVDIAAGAGNFLTITVAGTVNPNAIGNLVNTATVAVGTGQTDPTPGNNTATDTDTPAAVVVAIGKTASPSTPVPGGPLTFTITVSNIGPGSANNSVLTDPPVPGYTATGVTCSASGGAVCPVGTPQQLLAAIQSPAGLLLPTFPSGSQMTFVMTGTFQLTSGALMNVATLTPPIGVPGDAGVGTAVVNAIGMIPTLGEYGLLTLMLLMAAAGGVFVRRARPLMR
ncbi:MAG: IPTL-CTERM sorting domain-containing protein [Burkholderiales bacterium]|nr:IPTL-CTERM sorting domain-containing protein [Burkholderiales bacterium]